MCVCSKCPEIWEDTEAVSPKGWTASQWALRNTDDFSMWIWHSDNTKFLRHSSSGTSSASSFSSLGKPVQPHKHLCDPTCLFHLTLYNMPQAKKVGDVAKKHHCTSLPVRYCWAAANEAVKSVNPKRTKPLSASLGDASVTVMWLIAHLPAQK